MGEEGHYPNTEGHRLDNCRRDLTPSEIYNWQSFRHLDFPPKPSQALSITSRHAQNFE